MANCFTIYSINQMSDLIYLSIYLSDEAFPGILGNRGIRPSISGEQGNKSLKLKGKGEQRQFWGTRENAYFFQGNKGTDTRSLREGNIHISDILYK